MNIYGMRPVNKTAAIVTTQEGTTDNFLLADKETLRVLGLRKKYFMDAIKNLRDEIGIDSKREKLGAKTKYPRHILRHPKFNQFLSLKESLTKLDAEIFKVRQGLKNAPDTFPERFIAKMKEKYPVIYEEIKNEVKAKP